MQVAKKAPKTFRHPSRSTSKMAKSGLRKNRIQAFHTNLTQKSLQCRHCRLCRHRRQSQRPGRQMSSQCSHLEVKLRTQRFRVAETAPRTLRVQSRTSPPCRLRRHRRQSQQVHAPSQAQRSSPSPHLFIPPRSISIPKAPRIPRHRALARSAQPSASIPIFPGPVASPRPNSTIRRCSPQHLASA